MINRTYFSFIAILFISLDLSAQSTLVAGQLLDQAGNGLPGVNVVIKGTTIGTITDIDGKYEITAPIGSTLVISFIGLETTEVLVGGGQPINRLVIPKSTSFFSDTATNLTPGTFTFNSNSPSYKSNGTLNLNRIRKINKLLKKQYFIKSEPQFNTGPRYQISYHSSLLVEKINRSPSLQKSFVQGRSINGTQTWLGPDENEIFS